MNDIDNLLCNCLYLVDIKAESSIDELYEECACKYGFKVLNQKT